MARRPIFPQAFFARAVAQRLAATFPARVHIDRQPDSATLFGHWLPTVTGAEYLVTLRFLPSD